MKRFFYDEWKQKRLTKIINIFGEDFFAFKEVLELGACHGDIGYELMKLGANVTFVEAREDNAKLITSMFRAERLGPKVHILDQNKPYDLGARFDLVLNLGVLYHLTNWKNDIKCSMNHTNTMVLETVVNPIQGASEKNVVVPKESRYGSVTGTQSLVTQEHIEHYLTELGCKFIRFDNSSLNTSWTWLQEGVRTRNVYDWQYGKTNSYTMEGHSIVQFRRMWLVIK